MIESYTYEIIKQEGIKEGHINSKRESIYDVLETRFEIVPMAMMTEINRIENVHVLEELHRKAVKASSIQAFKEILKAVLAPA